MNITPHIEFTWWIDPTSKAHKTEDIQDTDLKPNSSDTQRYGLNDAPYAIYLKQASSLFINL